MITKKHSATRAKQALVVALAAFGVCAGAATGAYADLRLEQTEVETGAPTPAGANAKPVKPITKKLTVFYKGDKRRIESDGVVTLYDAATEMTTYLDPRKKTYFTLAATGQAASSGNPLIDMSNFVGEATVIDTQEQKSIAGKTARHYTYAITVTLVPKDAGVPANIRLLLPTFLVTGDQWTADMPDGVAAAKLRTATFMQRFPPASAKGLAPVLEKMATIKGVALEGTQSFRITVSDLAPQEMRASIPKEPVVTQTRTTTLSEAALPDALFAVPKDYKKVTAPAS